jgi:hypothetical protein
MEARTQVGTLFGGWHDPQYNAAAPRRHPCIKVTEG